MPKNTNPRSAKLATGKLRDLAEEMHRFAMNMRRDDADARDSTLSPYADALDGFSESIKRLAPL